MDDLAGLNWSAPSQGKPANAQSAPTNPAVAAYPSLRPSPSPFTSGRNTPLSNQGSGSIGAKPSAPKPAQDSFGNLLSFGSGKNNANLSLRERQDQLEAEKRKKEEERRKQAQAHYGDGRFFDSLGQNQSGSSRTASPAIPAPPYVQGPSVGAQHGKPPAESDDDLFAAFSASTKVDNSSHFPPPAPPSNPSPANAPQLDLANPQAWGPPAASGSGGSAGDDDDDPFGLNQFQTKANQPPPQASKDVDEDDDLLGDLGKPVDQVRKKAAPAFAREPEPGKPIEDSSSDSEVEPPAASDDPFDKAVAQLVDYGFTPENARRGLTESGGGLNVQAAVNWLLDDAHRQAKEKTKGRGSAREQPRDRGERAPSQSRNGAPSWMREGDDDVRRNDNRSPAPMDGDFAKTAAAVGSSFLKSANSLWKTGQKKVQKAVAEFQQDGDPNQPKWMRPNQEQGVGASTRRQVPDVTDEALMLESGGRPEARSGRLAPQSRDSSGPRSRERSPALPARPAKGSQAPPTWQQISQPPPNPRARVSKQAAEEESFQAYVSPARRKKATPRPQPEARLDEPEPDLLFGAAPSASRSTPQARSSQASPAPRPAARPSPAPKPAPPRPVRQIPSISPIALQNSTKCRLEGTAHFKRGDFAAAHASYTSSMTAIPQDHPLSILLLCNRALTALKTGEPRQAVEDADTAIRLIGPGKGEGELVDLQGANGAPGEKRDMRDLYGKALSRKAEALEQMEKWADAAVVWQLCVEAGLGGATAAAGRQRCQKALAPKPAPAARPASTRPAAAAAAPRPARPSANPQKSFEAVERLRATHQAAEREGDEKLALTDKVDARIAAWRDGKRDNLRALLGSLDTVLWEDSGWTKVGLHELVVAKKVKIIYMKAIAKTHPDKVSFCSVLCVYMARGAWLLTGLVC